MTTFNTFIARAAATLALSFSAVATLQAAEPLSLQVFNADENSFHVNSVLISGEQDAVLVDTQFTRADAHRLVANILSSGKTLKAIYISHGDPDYYFGAEVIRKEFPDVPVYASAPTIEWIRDTVEKKVSFWGPKMGANAPQNPVIPEPLPVGGLSLEGYPLIVTGLHGDQSRRSYLWIPDIKAVVGGVNLYSDLHLWMADAQSKEARRDWGRALEGIEALQPNYVIPGHMAEGAPTGLDAVEYSRTYLTTYEQALDKAKNSAELIEATKLHYPNAGLGIALEIGAKVNTGEMKW
jgi:glyoxylase-like metal-dependent hydrolase (beta-lactamase superfamily II)